MKEEPYLFELSGEHPSLPLAELEACICATNGHVQAELEGPGYAIFQLSEAALHSTMSRLALTHRAGRYLGSCEMSELSDFCPSLDIPEGSMAVRVKRYEGSGSPEQANTVMRKVGEVVSRRRRIDLTHPDHRIRIILTDRLHFFLDEFRVDRDQFEQRHVRSRPFFSPISLHPRYARALVNLTRIRPGEILLDPFCGTGGILMEAALVGARTIGSDASPEMIEGCAENMKHFGIRQGRLQVLDVGEIAEEFPRVDAVATDPPYGRSASTMKEQVKELHGRAFRSIGQVLKLDGTAGVVLPYPFSGSPELQMCRAFHQRVHRSLDRHYCVLKPRV